MKRVKLGMTLKEVHNYELAKEKRIMTRKESTKGTKETKAATTHLTVCVCVCVWMCVYVCAYVCMRAKFFTISTDNETTIFIYIKIAFVNKLIVLLQ